MNPGPPGHEPRSRTLRFGAQLPAPPEGSSWGEAVDRIEQLGYATLSMPDHVGPQLSPVPALAAAAACTSRLRLTTSVLANDFRNPVVLAKDIATLDVLSGGRVELGIGTGWMTEDYAATGLSLDRPGVRLARLSESVDLMRLIWEGRPVQFEGDHYRVSGLTGTPAPVQRPIPVMLGGSGRRMLGLAAAKGDIVSIGINARAGVLNRDSYADACRDAVDQKIAWVREAAGVRWPGLEVCVRVLRAEITDDPDGAVRRHAAQLGLAPSQVLDSPHFLVGTSDQVTRDLYRYREELGVSYYVISGASAESMAPIVRQVSGT